MTMLDSVAEFETRAAEIGMSPTELAVISAKGWDNFGTFAFACGYSPGGPDEARLQHLAAVITGSGATEPPDTRMPAIRRLCF